MKFIRLFLIIFLFTFSLKLTAQDPHFSQFHANPMYLNPAYTGANFCPRVIMNYRNQWPALAGDYVTYNTSFDFGLNEIHGGLGLIVMHDSQGWGVLNTNKISLLYSYHATLSGTTTLSGGFQFSYFERQLNTNQDFGDEIDQLYGFIYDREFFDYIVNNITEINNRNLDTLEVSLNTSISLAKILSSHKNPLVCESGINSVENIKFIVKNTGIYNFLIGESLLKSHDIGLQLRKFTEISL